MARRGPRGLRAPPAADRGGALVGDDADATTAISTAARVWRLRSSWPATARRALRSRARVPRGEPGRAGARAEDAPAPRASPARSARRRRGRARRRADRRGLRARPARPARGTRRPSPRPDASPPSRARSPRSTPTSALLLALEAGRLDDSVDSRGALLGALEHGSRIRAWLQGFDSPVERDRVQSRRQAPGDRDARRDHALGHGDLASRRPAAAIVAGRLGGGRLQPGRADACHRGRKGPRRAVGRIDEEGAAGADRPGGRGIRRARARRRSLQPRRQGHRRGRRWRRTT